LAVLRPSYEELVERAKALIQTLTPINQFHESSVAGAIVRVFAALMSQMYDTLEQLERDSNLSTATGLALDRIGQTFGVLRLPARRASSFGAAEPVKFTNNTSAAVTVPAGTRVFSSRFPYKAYRTVDTINVPAGGEAYVHVVAEGDGSDYNAGAGEIDRHNLPVTGLQVVNVAPLVDASDAESDESYRARIAQAFLRRYYGSSAAITAALRELPGVVDVVLLPTRRGPGTLDVFVVPAVLPADGEFVQSLQEVLDREVVPGIDWRLIIPDPTPVDVMVRVKMRVGWSQALVDSVRLAVRGYVDNIGLEGTLYASELLSRVMDVSTDIEDAEVRVFVRGLEIDRSYTADVMEVLRSRNVDIMPF
jgi:uncharacterized phage protein gp47/JayE